MLQLFYRSKLDLKTAAFWIASSNVFTQTRLTYLAEQRREHYVAHFRCFIHVLPVHPVRLNRKLRVRQAHTCPSRQPAYRYGTHLLWIHYAKLAQLQPNFCAKVIVFSAISLCRVYTPAVRKFFLFAQLNSSAFCTGAWRGRHSDSTDHLNFSACVASWRGVHAYPSVIRSLIGVTRVFKKCLCTHRRHPNMPASHRGRRTTGGHELHWMWRTS